MRPPRALCIAIHDVAPATWALCRQLADMIAEIDPAAPLTLLVVPNFHDGGEAAPAAYIDWLHARVARGDEIALHGYTHRDEAAARARGTQRLIRRVYTSGEGEFAALSHADALRRVARGRLWCAANGLEVRGFVAPAWLLGRDAWRAVCEFDFHYTTTLTRFFALRSGRSVYAPSIAYSTRSGARRLLSRLGTRTLAASSGSAPLLRVGLHPVDARYADIKRDARRLLEMLCGVRVPVTKSEYAHRLQPQSANLRIARIEHA